MAIALGVLVLVAIAALIAGTAWYLGPAGGGASELAAERAALADRLARLTRRLADVRAGPPDLAAPDLAPADLAAPDLAAPDLAAPDLAGAEAAVAASPGDAAAHAGLAHALLERGDLDAAAGEAARALELDAASALGHLVAGRAAYQRAAAAAGPASAALLAPGELALLQRERTRRGAGQPMPAAFADHLRRYHAALAEILAAAELEPGRIDAVHHAARVAIKVGLIGEGRALLERAALLAAGTGSAGAIDRDLAQLRADDLTGAQAADRTAGLRRSPRLRVLR